MSDAQADQTNADHGETSSAAEYDMSAQGAQGEMPTVKIVRYTVHKPVTSHHII